jgi:hypothetical protein
MNTIGGNINDSIRNAINTDNYKLLLDDALTFFGAFYDTIPKPIVSKFLLEERDVIKYKLLEYV